MADLPLLCHLMNNMLLVEINVPFILICFVPPSLVNSCTSIRAHYMASIFIHMKFCYVTDDKHSHILHFLYLILLSKQNLNAL